MKQKMNEALLSRLKFMGYIFIALGLVSLIYAFYVQSHPSSPSSIMDEYFMLDEPPAEKVLNFYFVSLLFGSIGASLFYTVFKRQKHEKP